MLAHRQEWFVLDRAFALIEGHPRLSSQEKWGTLLRRVVERVIAPIEIS